MTITISSFFWLSVTWLLVAVALELRKQKILSTLAGNLVTVQIKNEDTADKLIVLTNHAAGIHSDLVSILDGQRADRKSQESLNEAYSALRRRLQEVADRQEQSKTVLTALVEEAVQGALGQMALRD